MAEKKEVASTRSPVSDWFQFGVYKRSQGRIARQITFFAILATIAVGCWRISEYLYSSQYLRGFGQPVYVGIPAVVLAVGIWISFRLVNLPRFADFLIAVEAEMNKVSWPTRSELMRSSVVVIVLLLLLTAILFVFDIVWQAFFRFLGVLG